MQTAAKPIVFYDGTCVLCHGFVRWVLANDQAAVFQFAPLQGETFTRTFATDQRQDLPDSVVVRNEAGGLYLRSDAVIYVLRTLGRAKLARALQMVPRGLRDLAYRFIAKIRYAVFGREKELCPLVPPGNRSRFLP